MLAEHQVNHSPLPAGLVRDRCHHLREIEFFPIQQSGQRLVCEDRSRIEHVRYRGPLWDAPIAPPGPRPSDGRWADNCGHSHFGYAVFNRVWIFNGSQWAVYITLRASEGRIGRRYEWINGAWQQSTARRSDLPCFVTSDPDLSGGIYAPYIWKNNIQNLDPSSSSSTRTAPPSFSWTRSPLRCRAPRTASATAATSCASRRSAWSRSAHGEAITAWGSSSHAFRSARSTFSFNFGPIGLLLP